MEISGQDKNKEASHGGTEGGKIVLFSHADTDTLLFRNACASVDQGRKSGGKAVALQSVLNLAGQELERLQAYGEQLAIIVRVLGAPQEIPGWAEFYQVVRQKQNWSLVVLSGSLERNPGFESLSTVDRSILDVMHAYLSNGGTHNFVNLIGFLRQALWGQQGKVSPPVVVPECGIYHPAAEASCGRIVTLDQWRQLHVGSLAGRPVVALNFYRAHWLSGNLTFVDAMVRALEQQGMNCLAIFSASGHSFPFELLAPPTGERVEVLINTMAFSLSGESSGDSSAVLERLNIPVLQAVCSSMTRDEYAGSARGLSALDTAMNVAMPEFDGRIITVPVSFKRRLDQDPNQEAAPAALYDVVVDRAERVAEIAWRLVQLRLKPASEKRIAFVFTNASSKASQIGNAVGLDAPASLFALLQRMQEQGYLIEDMPAASDVLMQTLIERCSYDNTILTDDQCANAIGLVSDKRYKSWFARLPQALQDGMVEQWGPAPGDAYVLDDQLVIAGIELGNAVVILQPPRGYGMDPNAIYHRPDLPPTHHYLAVYAWLSEQWQADAIVHVGKHGTLEWLPGKGVGLSSGCFPDALLGPMPLIYPFIINDPGEGAQAKRRGHAVIVDHLMPPLTTADTYGVLSELTLLVDEYYQCEALDPSKLPLLRQQIWQLIKEANLDKDLGLIVDHDHDDDDDHDHDHDHDHGDGHHHHDHDEHDQHHEHEHDHDHEEWDDTLTEEGVPVSLAVMDSVKVSHLVQDIDGYLCELGAAQIRDGLHILGKAPAGDELIDTLCCFTRVANGNVPGMHASLAEQFSLDYESLLDRRGRPLTAAEKERAQALKDASGKELHSQADALEALDQVAARLYRLLFDCEYDCGRIDEVCSAVFAGAEVLPGVKSVLKFVCKDLVRRLRLTDKEIDSVLSALAGGYIPPGPSGAPSRGMAHILPTGKNFYSVDPRNVPSQAAWTVGAQLAAEVVKRFLAETSVFPESIFISMWGTSAMRTHGDDIAEVLALLGVRPCWQPTTRRVADLELIPLAELGRPRIDVTVRISGLFRDAFPHLIELMDRAFTLAMEADESPEQNFVRKHYLEEKEERLQAGEPEDECDKRCRFRVFGSKPGTYGADILGLIQEQNWQTDSDLAETYLNWGGFAYSRQEHGVDAREDLTTRLRGVQIAVHNQDNREHDIFDSDDYLQFHGGVIATIRSLTGSNPHKYFGDSQNPARPVVKDLQAEALKVFRSRVVNPKWIESIKKHGYKGGLELAATVDYLFGYDATADILEDWMYEQVAQTYALDPAMQEFLQESNPWALKGISERLLEAAQRKLWQEPPAQMLSDLQKAYLDSEMVLERKGNREEQRGTSDVSV